MVSRLLASLFLAALLTVSGAARSAHAQPQAGRADASPDPVPVTKEAPLSFAAARPALPSSSLRVGSTFVVTSAADTGAGSLRVAITSANALAGLDRIEFAIPGSGVQRITLKTVLPTITSPVVIDGTTQPGYAGSPLVEVTWGGVVAAANGLTITAGSSTVRGLILNGFPTTGATTGYAIWLDIQGGNVVEGCWIGLDPTGAAARPNGNVGITIRGGSGFNRIGGYTAAARNVIAGNATTALSITSGGTGRNRIVGNWFGLNATGTAVLPNGGNNLFIAAPDDTIGGTEPGARNVITGSGVGFPDVFLANTAPRTIVRGNWIGLMPSGTAEGNSPANGINVRSADNVIGDLSTDGRNVIGGTDRAAIYVFSATALRNRIHGNYLGTDATGMVALGDHTGITIDTASDNTIGGVTFLSRNVIGGMTGPAVSLITGSTRNTVIGNYLGVGADGLVALPNGDGVQIMDAPGNRIGGTSSGERNVISGNNGFGVVVRGAAATGNRIIGNWIGPAADSSALGNIKAGVFVGASRDTVGGLFGGEANTIAFNFAEGIVESSGTGSPLAGNHIHSNTGRGIDLFPYGLTPNDSLDLDSGSNGLQNFPTIDSVSVRGVNHRISFHHVGPPFTRYTYVLYRNDFVDGSHFGEGEQICDDVTFRTLASGMNRLFVDVPMSPTPVFYTLTATDSLGNTSEFSQAFCSSDADGDGLPDCWETQGWGIDVNSDGLVDADLYAMGARPDHKDLFVEIDGMLGCMPPAGTAALVAAAFDSLPTTQISNPDGTGGVHLFAAVSDSFPATLLPAGWPQVDSLKNLWFGTAAERNSPNARHILAAKRLYSRWGLWAMTFGTGAQTAWSGIAEPGFRQACDDFVVTLGTWIPVRKLDIRVHAGTFMHEFGHTLGLRHGGGDSEAYKPNYVSVMSYLWQLPIFPWQAPGSWKLDYSRAQLDTLRENSLDESVGFGNVPSEQRVVMVPYSDANGVVQQATLQQGGTVDWSGDGTIQTTNYTGDLNVLSSGFSSSPGQRFGGFQDWPTLQYDFRNSTSFQPVPGHGTIPERAFERLEELVEEPELSMEDDSLHQLLPPPRPKGRYVMDGVIDSRARRVATNAGAELWADYRDGVLYVAATSPGGASEDLHVLVSTSRGALVAAPDGRAGQVGAFAADLSRHGVSLDPSWRNGAGQDLTVISLDTTGTALEGVMNVSLLTQRLHGTVYLALARYDSASGGALLAQVPAGDADGNVDGGEYAEWLGTTGVNLPALPPADGFAMALASASPSHAGTTVRLTLPHAARVDVRLLDVAGREVASIAHDEFKAGTHTIAWKPAPGRAPAPGVYFVEARSEGRTRTARLVIVR